MPAKGPFPHSMVGLGSVFSVQCCLSTAPSVSVSVKVCVCVCVPMSVRVCVVCVCVCVLCVW